MIATNPIVLDGQTFDRWSINLAITGKYNGDGSPDASICMRLVPTRIAPATTDNEIPAQAVTADNAAIGILRGRLSEINDPAEAEAVTAITTALQTYITTKGL